VFPRLVAPGLGVRTTDISHGGVPTYATMSGTSLAAPHVAGVLALLAGAFPAASVDELEAALVRGAQDLGDGGPDSRYGHGLVQALAAFNGLRDERGPAAQGATVLGGLAHPDSRNAARSLQAHERQDAGPASGMRER
jgi:subtilisin family serine protease